MKLIIAEKPSVAQSIAKVIGADTRKNGYIEGNGYIVSWCVGHLIGLDFPESYGEQYKSWKELPIIPTNWHYSTKPESKAQYDTLASLMADSRVTSLVCATDAGREGELIFRHVYNYAGCKKPFERLWISSLEDSAIKQGFESLKNGNEYDNLYQSALCRERADWLVGINGTRKLTTMYNASPVLSIGRVQTPTLAMIVERDNSISNFVKQKYYTVDLDCGGWTAVSDKINDLEQAQQTANSCHSATIISVLNEEKKASPPKLYDLTSLQRDANRIYGLTAKQTLDSVQSLYDNKLSTYPRTDSQYLTEDMETTARSIMDIIKNKFDFAAGYEYEPNIAVIMDNSKVSDHHAIIPTANIQNADLSALSQNDSKILNLISLRLLSATSGKYVYNSTRVELSCNGNTYKATGKSVISKGFKLIEERYNSSQRIEEEKSESPLPQLFENQQLDVSGSVKEHFTSPPKPYTEDTLLSAMERAGNNDYDTDDVERKGLGTPATRAEIIEKIISVGYVTRSKKQLVSTERGRKLIEIAPEALKSAKMTAEWENKLVLISKGIADSNAFMSDIPSFVTSVVTDNTVNEAMKDSFSTKEVIGICPRCGKNVYEGKLNFYCENNRECGFTLWKNNRFFEDKKKAVTKAVAQSLLKNGKVHLKGLYSSKKNSTYNADVVLDAGDSGDNYVNFKLEFNQPNGGKKNG